MKIVRVNVAAVLFVSSTALVIVTYRKVIAITYNACFFFCGEGNKDSTQLLPDDRSRHSQTHTLQVQCVPRMPEFRDGRVQRWALPLPSGTRVVYVVIYAALVFKSVG